MPAYTACIDPMMATPATCRAFAQTSARNAACVGCILTPESAAMYGPFVDHGTFITENVGGCIQLADPGSLTCAKAQQALTGCELAACQARCPVYDPSSRKGLDVCTFTAASGGCQMFATQASCASALVEAGGSPACKSQIFETFFFEVVPHFCGPLPDAMPTPFDAAVIGTEGGSDAAAQDAAGDATGDVAGDAARDAALDAPRDAPQDGVGGDARADAPGD